MESDLKESFIEMMKTVDRPVPIDVLAQKLGVSSLIITTLMCQAGFTELDILRHKINPEVSHYSSRRNFKPLTEAERIYHRKTLEKDG